MDRRQTTNRLQTFTNSCRRRKMNIWWSDRERNVDLWKRTSQDLIEKMELDWERPQETCHKQLTRKKEERSTQEQLEERCPGRNDQE